MLSSYLEISGDNISNWLESPGLGWWAGWDKAGLMQHTGDIQGGWLHSGLVGGWELSRRKDKSHGQTRPQAKMIIAVLNQDQLDSLFFTEYIGKAVFINVG